MCVSLRKSCKNNTLYISADIARFRYDKACWQVVKTFIDKNAYEGNQEFMEGFRDELNRFIESGSVHPSPTMDDLNEDTGERERTGTKISGSTVQQNTK